MYANCDNVSLVIETTTHLSYTALRYETRLHVHIQGHAVHKVRLTLERREDKVDQGEVRRSASTAKSYCNDSCN